MGFPQNQGATVRSFQICSRERQSKQFYVNFHDKWRVICRDIWRIGAGWASRWPPELNLDSDAETGIPAGLKWEQVLYARLKDCRALIVLCSANWQESRWCFAELVFAKAMGKEIFPVLLQECSIDQVAAEHQAVFVYKEGEAAYARLWDVLLRNVFPERSPSVRLRDSGRRSAPGNRPTLATAAR
jgi:hypothetical protein